MFALLLGGLLSAPATALVASPSFRHPSSTPRMTAQIRSVAAAPTFLTSCTTTVTNTARVAVTAAICRPRLSSAFVLAAVAVQVLRKRRVEKKIEEEAAPEEPFWAPFTALAEAGAAATATAAAASFSGAVDVLQDWTEDAN